MSALPEEARSILERGRLCYLAAPSPAGPHLTPVVFVLDGGRLWGTTGRRTTKAKLWRRDPSAAGLVRLGESWLTFRGSVDLYDALDPSSWARSVLRGPRLASASARFTRKNARFFAGYAVDARRVPLSWTPPGRVIFSVDLAEGVVVSEDGANTRWGRGAIGGDDRSPAQGDGARDSGRGASDESLSGSHAESSDWFAEGLPENLRGLLDDPGEAVAAFTDADGPTVLPARWARRDGSFLVEVRAAFGAPIGSGDAASASLVIDRASAWRAAKMRGVLLRGRVSAASAGSETSLQEAGRTATYLDERIVELHPRRVVWWSGWSSGTVTPP